MGLLNKEEWLEFERLCDVEGISDSERLQIVRDVFGKSEARLYEERRCKILTFGGRENPRGACKVSGESDLQNRISST